MGEEEREREREGRTSLLAVSATAVATLATAVSALATAVSATESATTATASALVGNVDTDATAVCKSARPFSIFGASDHESEEGRDIPYLMQVRASWCGADERGR